MLKKPIMFAFMALALVFSVFAVGGLNIVESSLSDTEDLGATASGTFTVDNTGSDDYTGISMTSSDLVGSKENVSSSAVTLSPSSADLTAGTNTSVSYSVAVPGMVYADTYTGEFEAKFNDSNKDTVTYSLTVNAAPNLGLTSSTDGKIAIDRSDNSIDSTTEAEFELSNTGNTDLSTVTITTSDLTSGSDTLSASDLSLSDNGFSLAYGDSKTVKVSYSVPGTQVSGTYTGTWEADFGGSSNLSLPVTIVVKDSELTLEFLDLEYDEHGRDLTVSDTLAVKNTGDITLNNIVITSSTSDVVVSGAPTTLAPGASATLTVETFVALSTDSGKRTAGTLAFTSDELNDSAEIFTNAKSMLKIDRIRMSVGNGGFESITSNFDKLDDEMKPGDEFQVKVRVENLFDDNDDQDFDIDDVRVEALFKDIGEDGDDIDGDSEEFDLNPEDEAEVDVDFDDDSIETDVDEGEYELLIIVEGVDEEGARHSDRMTVRVDVDVENEEDYRLTKVAVAPTTVQCGESFEVLVSGENLGGRSDKNSGVEVTQTNLDLFDRKEFKIGDYRDEDCNAVAEPDEFCREFGYRKAFFVPRDTTPGEYELRAVFFHDTNDAGDADTVKIRVSCGAEEVPEQEEQETTEDSTESEIDLVVVPEEETPEETNGQSTEAPSEEVEDDADFSESGLYLALVGVANLLLIGAIVALFLHFMMKRRG